MPEKLKFAIIGLGNRGDNQLHRYAEMPDVEITAVCDLYDDRIAAAQEAVKTIAGNCPRAYKDYEELLTKEKLDAVLVITSWTTHSRIVVAALKHGVRVASEVYGAASLEECWELVRTSEQTGIPVMLLENCNYGRKELALLNMAKQGIFGELVHCECGYEHDLRDEITRGNENRHYRFANYKHRCGDVYPTHGLGPMSKILHINRGNRFVSLVSMASKQRGLVPYAKEHMDASHIAANTNFTMGDVVTTIIKCAGGETIVLTHDTSLPRPYSRGGRVQGTKGIWMEDKSAIYLDGVSPKEHEWEDFEPYMDKYDHPIWKRCEEEAIKDGGHGGMDWILARAFIESVRDKTYPPIDVYDMAAWTAVTVLSEASIALGGAPQVFPDFTNGSWLDGTMPKAGGDFSLE